MVIDNIYLPADIYKPQYKYNLNIHVTFPFTIICDLVVTWLLREQVQSIEFWYWDNYL